MDNIIHHPHFDRPPVHQPCPRRRRGTISFRRAAADLQWRRQWKRVNERREQQSSRLREPSWSELRSMVFRERLQAELDESPLYPHVPLDELDRVLTAGGLCRGVSLKDGCAVIMRDEDVPPAA